MTSREAFQRAKSLARQETEACQAIMFNAQNDVLKLRNQEQAEIPTLPNDQDVRVSRALYWDKQCADVVAKAQADVNKIYPGGAAVF